MLLSTVHGIRIRPMFLRTGLFCWFKHIYLRPNNPGSVLGPKQNALSIFAKKFRKFQHGYKNILRILNMRSKFVFSKEKADIGQILPGSTVCCTVEQTRPRVAQSRHVQ
jgi:hypothetical protein